MNLLMTKLHRMALLDRAVMERLTISLRSEQRAEVASIARDHGASEAAVIRAALDLGLPELKKRLLAEATHGLPGDYSKLGSVELARPMLKQYETEADPPANGDGTGE